MHSQSLITPQINGVRLTDRGFLVEKPAMTKLVYWGTVGIECSKSLQSSIQLVDQIARAKIISDSISISLNGSLFNMKNEVQLERNNRARLEGMISVKDKTIEEQNEKISKLQRDKALLSGSILAAIIATVLIVK